MIRASGLLAAALTVWCACASFASTGADSLGLALLRERITVREWAAAESAAVRLMDEAEAGPDSAHPHSRIIELSHLVQDLLEAQAREKFHGQTADLGSRAVAILEKHLAADHPEVGSALRRQSKLLYDSGDLAGARPLAERALRIHEAAGDSTGPELAASMENMAFFHGASGELQPALALYERVLAIRKQALGSEHPAVAAALHRVGFTRAALGDYAGAIAPMEEALRIRIAKLPADDPAIATSYNDLALPHYYLGSFATADSLLQRALALRERRFGPEHPALAKTIDLLALVQFGRGRPEEAHRLWSRSLAIRERTQGPGHRDLAPVLLNLMLASSELGEYEEAAALGERALEIYKAALGEGHPQVGLALDGLGSAYLDLGDPVRARRCFEQSLRVQTEALGPEHPDMASVLWNLGSLLSDSGELEGARPLLERSRKIREAALGPDHPLVAGNLVGLGRLAMREGRSADAEADFAEALAILAKHADPDDPRCAGPLWGMAEVAEANKEAARAESLYTRVLRIRQTCFGEDHPGIAEALERLGWIEAARGRTEDALEDALAAERISREHLRLTARTSPELLALSFAEYRVRGLDLALSVLAKSEPGPGGSRAPSAGLTSGDPGEPQRRARRLERVWESLAGSRALVLDEMAERRRGLRMAATQEADSLQRSWLAARRRLAHLLLQEDGEAADRSTLDEARRRVETTERALAAVSAGFRGEGRTRPVTAAEALGWMPPGGALVSYVRVQQKPLPGRIARADSAFYAAFVLRASPGTQTAEISFLRLGDAVDIDRLVERWREEARFGPTVPGREAAAAEASYREVALSLRRAIWDPVEPLVRGNNRLFLVPDRSLWFVNFAALPADGGGYLVEQDLLFHSLGAERDLEGTADDSAPTRQDPAIAGARERSQIEPILALGAPDFDAPRADLLAAAAPADGDPALPAGTRPVWRGPSIGCRLFRDAVFRPIPGSAGEVAEIARIAGSMGSTGNTGGTAGGFRTAGTRVLTGAAANEGAFKRLANGRRILHLATHGFFLGEECRTGGASGTALNGKNGDAENGKNGEVAQRGISGLVPNGTTTASGSGRVEAPDENPLLLSGLALAGANARNSAGLEEEDGILTAEEIGTLDLTGAEWAVLSACETGVGVVHGSEGILGLQRAFRIAGVRTVVMSLWAVEDEKTQQWMSALYNARLRDSLSTAECVRRADRLILAEARAAGRTTHPFGWGAFVATGDWR